MIAQFYSKFDELHEQGKTLILVTHDRDLAALADVRLVLRDGRRVAEPEAVAR